jgi:hypothetical protein
LIIEKFPYVRKGAGIESLLVTYSTPQRSVTGHPTRPRGVADYRQQIVRAPTGESDAVDEPDVQEDDAVARYESDRVVTSSGAPPTHVPLTAAVASAGAVQVPLAKTDTLAAEQVVDTAHALHAEQFSVTSSCTWNSRVNSVESGHDVVPALTIQAEKPAGAVPLQTALPSTAGTSQIRCADRVT